MRKQIWLFLFIGVLGLWGPTSASALNIDLVPGFQIVDPGDTFTLDIVVSGLEAVTPNEIVSAYDLDVTYNSSAFTATNVTFGSLLGSSLQNFSLATLGVVDLAEVSLESDADLAVLQGDSVTLATLAFMASGSGGGNFNFVFNATNDIKGNSAAVLDLTAGTAAVAVTPEPGTLVLLASGFACFMLHRRIRIRIA
jgi:hypothetical protein